MNQTQAPSQKKVSLNRQPKLQEAHANMILNLLSEYQASLTLTLNHLETERKSIAQRDFSQLKNTVEKKDQILDTVSKQEDQLFTILKKYSITRENPKGITDLIEKYEGRHQPKLATAWRQTTDLLKNCSRANLVNNKVISHSKSHLSRLISILKGIDQNAKTYQSDGQPQTNTSCRILAKV